MHISHLVIKNFRALEDIECDLSPRINVIVGPNAVGKTTILQAIRLAKAIIAPRTQQETLQVLISLSAASPHFPQRLFFNSLTRDIQKALEVRCTYVLTEDEITQLKIDQAEVVQSIVAARVGQAFSNPAALVQFLQSPQGQQTTASVKSEVTAALTKLENTKSLMVGITISALTGQIQPADSLGAPLVGFLDQRLPPSQSLFSYFPADRALPMGEVNLQLGGPDAQQQLESHNSQPQLKYMRLKNLIINALVIGTNESDTIYSEFEKIFSGLLKGRIIKTIGVNELGLLSVITEELKTGRLIELDSLSSGEKNIALTFLIVATSLARGGVALFDEPELHLNPAVSRELLPFMIENYSKPREIQFILCTHSPEILSGAFSDDDCTLLHLKSSSDITRVGKRALAEYAESLERLGTSVSESLLYEGTLLVEGRDDVFFLETAFPDIFKRFKIKDRGGRREIEKTIVELQEMEQKGQRVAPIYMLFDRDDDVTKLQSSKSVKILQWGRRCIDNYLIDIDVIAELLRDDTVTRQTISSEGEVHNLLRDLAYEQLNLIAAREVYAKMSYLNASMTKTDMQDGSLLQLATALYARASNARASIPDTPADEWISEFISLAEARRLEMRLTWEGKWKDLCDGKRLLSDFHKKADLKMSEHAFKAKVARMMRDTSSDNWRLVKSLLDDFLNTSG